MRSKITFEDSVTGMKGSFTIHLKNGSSYRNVKLLFEFNDQLRFMKEDAMGEFRVALEDIEEIIIARWKDVEITR